MTTFYIMCKQSETVRKKEVYLGDIVKIWCDDHEKTERAEAILMHCFKDGKNEKKTAVVSNIDILSAVITMFPDVNVQILGEPAILVEYKSNKKRGAVKLFFLTLFVSMICFFGTAFTIMAYHNDIGIKGVFTNVYRTLAGENPAKGSMNTIEITYSIGLFLGIVLFFNHFFGKKVTDDPTPIEVAMQNYKSDIELTVLDEDSSK